MGSIPTGGTPSKVDETEDERIVSARGHNGVSARQRVFALLAIGTGLLLALTVVVYLSRNAQYVLVGLVGLALLGGGGWWVITEQMPRRRHRRGTAVVGLVLIGGGGDRRPRGAPTRRCCGSCSSSSSSAPPSGSPAPR